MARAIATRFCVFKFPGRDNLFDDNDFQNMSGDVYAQKTEKAFCYYRDDIRITEDYVQAGINGGKDLLYCIATGNYRYGTLFCNCFGNRQILLVYQVKNIILSAKVLTICLVWLVY